MLRFAPTALLALLALTLPTAAGAEVVVKGTGEPEFTNTDNNTQWVEWSNNGNYRVEFQHRVNAATPVVDGPYQVAKTGSTSVNWAGIRGVSTPLIEGSKYTICGFGRWDDGSGMYFPDFSSSCGDADRRGLRASTTIDRTAPAISVELAKGAATTRNAALALRIDFTDNLAGPFPANFLCLQAGTSPAGTICDATYGAKYVEQPACSVPLSSGRKTNVFECTVEATTTPDGPVSVCVMAADAAIPDNPSDADQRRPSTTANRSAPKCATTVLDRVAPAASIDAPAAVAGTPVRLTAQASDLTTGLDVGSASLWPGDGSAPLKGTDVTHTFERAGTYEVRFAVADRAGNTTEVRREVKVSAPSAGTPVTPDPGTTPPNAGPGPRNEPPAPVLSGDVSLAVRASSAVQRKRRVLRLTVAGAMGPARLVLKRGSVVVATKTVRFTKGRAALTLGKGVPKGRYTATVTLGTRSGTASLRIGRAPKARGASAAHATVAPSKRPPVLPGLPG